MYKTFVYRYLSSDLKARNVIFCDSYIVSGRYIYLLTKIY